MKMISKRRQQKSIKIKKIIRQHLITKIEISQPCFLNANNTFLLFGSFDQHFRKFDTNFEV